MSKKIFILGAGTMQLPAIKIAKSMGLKVFVADGNSQAPGAHFADSFFHVDLKDKAALLETAGSIDGLSGAFTAGTDFSASVAFVTDALTLPGISHETALNASHKHLMRKVFFDNNVPSPRFISTENAQVSLDSLAPPFIIKPVDNMGARGVRLEESLEDVPTAINESLKFSNIRRVIVEEFIEGPEFSIDALVWNGSIKIFGIADRHIFFKPFFVELGHTMPSKLQKDQLDRIIEVFESAVRALGIDFGAAKGDVFLHPQKGPVIGEIAARLSGGYMSGWTFPYSSGLEVTKEALRIAIGEEPNFQAPLYNQVSCERAFISIPGKIKAITGLHEARLLHGIKKVFPRSNVGDEVFFPVNNVQKCGNIISCGRNHTDAEDIARTAIKNIFLELEPDNSATENFLFGENQLPAAFPLNFALFEKHPELFRKFNFPDDHKEEVDWYFHDIQSIQEKLNIMYDTSSFAQVNFCTINYWRSLLKGGLQGVVWYIESLKK